MTADPPEEQHALAEAAEASERRALVALRERQALNGSSNGNGHRD